MGMPIKNIIAGVVLALLGLVYGWLATRLPDRGALHVPGPAFFPDLIASIMVVLSLVLVAKGTRDLLRGDEPVGRPALSLKGVAVLAVIALYIYLLPTLGYLFAGVPFFAALMWLSGTRKWIPLIVGSIVIPAALFYLFRDGFQILLPHASWM